MLWSGMLLRQANEILRKASAYFPHAGSTARSTAEGLNRRSPRGLRGRAELQSVAIATSIYYEHVAQRRHPDQRSVRSRRDEQLVPKTQRVWKRKVSHLRRAQGRGGSYGASGLMSRIARCSA